MTNPFTSDTLQAILHQRIEQLPEHPEVREAYRFWWEGRRWEFRGDADPWRYLALESTALDGFVAMSTVHTVDSDARIVCIFPELVASMP